MPSQQERAKWGTGISYDGSEARGKVNQGADIRESLNKWEAGRTKRKSEGEGISLRSGLGFIKMKLANCHSPSVNI